MQFIICLCTYICMIINTCRLKIFKKSLNLKSNFPGNVVLQESIPLAHRIVSLLKLSNTFSLPCFENEKDVSLFTLLFRLAWGYYVLLIP